MHERAYIAIRGARDLIDDFHRRVRQGVDFETITRPDGSQISGRIIESTDDRLTLATNPYDLTQTIAIARNQQDQVTPSPASPMPAGLVNRLNAEELKDLLAYLMNAP